MTAHQTLDSDALRTLLSGIKDTSWSWREQDVPALAARFGWDALELIPGTGAVVDPGYGLGNKAYRMTFDNGDVHKITMRISSKAAKDDAAGQVFLGDVFADTAAMATEILGAPTARTPGARPEIRWRGKESTLILKQLGIGVTLSWASNGWQDHWDALDPA